MLAVAAVFFASCCSLCCLLQSFPSGLSCLCLYPLLSGMKELFCGWENLYNWWVKLKADVLGNPMTLTYYIPQSDPNGGLVKDSVVMEGLVYILCGASAVSSHVYAVI